jgi:hypothetical protein
MKQTKRSIKSHRHELVHGEDADFIAYQRKFGDGLWQTVKAGVRKQDVFINLVDVLPANWSFGNGEMQYARAFTPSEAMEL